MPTPAHHCKSARGVDFLLSKLYQRTSAWLATIQSVKSKILSLLIFSRCSYPFWPNGVCIQSVQQLSSVSKNCFPRVLFLKTASKPSRFTSMIYLLSICVVFQYFLLEKAHDTSKRWIPKDTFRNMFFSQGPLLSLGNVPIENPTRLIVIIPIYFFDV